MAQIADGRGPGHKGVWIQSGRVGGGAVLGK